jgi:hypothetical protein
MNRECDNLDAHLDGDLRAREAAQFANHLSRCADCRDAVDEQRWVDDLLRSDAVMATESPPDGLRLAVRTLLAQRRRQNRLVACGLAAAAALLAALGWIQLHRPAGGTVELAANQFGGSPLNNLPSNDPPKATFVSGANSIAVPVASKHTNVTVVRVYPTIQPAAKPPTITNDPPDAMPSSDIWSPLSNGG